MNKSIPVINLSMPKKSNAVFYVSSHTGVIFNIDKNSQILLQGHVSTCRFYSKELNNYLNSGDSLSLVIMLTILCCSVCVSQWFFYFKNIKKYLCLLLSFTCSCNCVPACVCVYVCVCVCIHECVDECMCLCVCM